MEYLIAAIAFLMLVPVMVIAFLAFKHLNFPTSLALKEMAEKTGEPIKKSLFPETGTITAEYQGIPFTCSFAYRYRAPLAMLAITLRQPQTVNFTIQYKRPFDRLEIRLDRAKTILSGDTALDQEFKITAATPELAKSMFQDKEFQKKILAVFSGENERLQVDKNGISYFRMMHLADTVKPDLVFRILATLHELGECLVSQSKQS